MRVSSMVTIFVAIVAMHAAPTAHADASPPPVRVPRSEAEYLVPPQGGAFEVPVHAGKVCILSFPEKLSNKALASSPDYEIKAWGDDGVAIRAIAASAAPTTLALASTSGSVKVNVTLSIVPAQKPAMTLVKFKAVSAEEAFTAQLEAGIKKRVVVLEEEVARLRKEIDARIRDRADGLMADRLLQRNEMVKVTAHGRNDEHVILHVTGGRLLGGDGYILFELENRSSAAYRLASVKVSSATIADLTGPARLATTAVDRDASIVGVVPAGATARGVVAVRSVDSVLGKPLVLEIAGPSGRGKIRIDRGLVLR
jgi:hypothetical protein